MVDVVSRRCEEADCRRRPLYGHEGEKGRFCSYHKVSPVLRQQQQWRAAACLHAVPELGQSECTYCSLAVARIVPEHDIY